MISELRIICISVLLMTVFAVASSPLLDEKESSLASIESYFQRIQNRFAEGSAFIGQPHVNQYSLPQSAPFSKQFLITTTTPPATTKRVTNTFESISASMASSLTNANVMDVQLSRKRQCTQRILEIKKNKNLTWEQMAKAVGRSPGWVTACCLGEASMDEISATKLVTFLDAQNKTGPDSLKAILMEPPIKGQIPADVLIQDPLIYRLHEITLVYGNTIKELVHEKFGDGIMSAIDFTMEVEKEKDPEGDRVRLVMSGKFLPYKRW